jgi:hypothetical protein
MYIPLKCPLVIESMINMLRISTVGRKRCGDSGKPCLRPCSTLKKEVDEPFINEEQVVLQVQFMI